ncbi:putative RNA polymerase II subunit B1 CTD phosphatase rpap2 isoform X1 [Poecilia reticulata]|uniref:putative RNA polymerase II subunit B1 CTD phosphatase rpap2 isoform X1 n=1 Tax=Poecilia reticulata TaxID=8081 RepID=UPI0007EBEE87|nr:PREDICTED: putative RNA polymerase II subunit B1 CTD phosphatase RPAP2 isoform X1 [Poecilia reticulata]
METEERRRRGGSAKSSKKGGKCVKVRTAEEEARRREEVKERLREKLELERRALKVVERLLEDSVAEDFLIDCAKLITPANYKDTVEERFIAKLCGYPACPNKLGKIPNQRFKISTKTNRVYDITERKCFCSNFCYKASKHYELQISKTPLWLRQHESSPPEVRLLKKGEGGSSGEEVLLSERRLKEEDIEDPLAAPPQDPPASERSAAGSDLSQSSDSEQEQDFVSSVVPQRRRAQVSWADLPRHTDEDGKQSEQRQIDEPEERKRAGGDDASPEDRPVEEATAKLNECSVSERVHPISDLPVNSHTEPSAGSKQAPNLAALSITQVGMSQRGAAGLRGLLITHSGNANPDSVRLNLLACLKRTLKEWCTDDTLCFLYGANRSLGSPFANVKETQEEELDEDDLEDEDDVTEPGAEEQDRGRSAAAPDYETLRKETERLQLRVTEFYRGTWILPEEEEMKPSKETESKDPVLPLIDSQAQNLIQKRITVEKLSSCLRNVVGPVGLTMSDISTDLNNLVRTFRFSNTNIIHKTPEWTLIAVVLLHLLSFVSPVVRDALEVSASVQYLNTLMEELGLQQHDLLSVVQLFKSSTN